MCNNTTPFVLVLLVLCTFNVISLW